MAKRNTTANRNKSGIIKKEEQVKPTKVSVVKKVTVSKPKKPEMVLIRFLYSVIYNYSCISGDKITFNGAGSEQLVSREDADILLSKIRKGCDCGVGARRFHIFEEV